MASMDDVLGSLDDQAKQKQAQTDKAASSAEAAQNTAQIVGAVDKASEATANGLKNVKGEVTVTNPTDMKGVVESINKLNLTAFMQNEGLPKLAQNLSDLSGKTQELQDKLENEGLKKMSDQLGLVVKKLDEVSKTLSKTEVTVDTKLQKTIDNLSKSIGAIDFNPNVTVSAPPAKVITTPIDFKPVLSALGSVEQAIKDSEAPETEIDLSAVTSGLADVHNAITALRFPVPNYVLPFRGIDGKATQVQLDANGNLPTAGGGGGGTQYTQGGPTVANPTGTSQIFFDASGNPLSVKATQALPVILGDNTNQINILKSDGTAAGQNAVLAAGARLEVAYTTGIVAAVASTDVSNYGFVSVQVNTQGTSSTVTFQTSNDNVTWVSTSLLTTAGNGGAAVSTATTGMWYGPLTGRYFRLNVTGISAGTTAGTIEFTNSPKVMHSANITAAQSGTWTVGLSALTTGGFTPGHIVSAATTNAAVIKASAGTLSSSSAFNISGSPRYVHFYNKATTPTVGTDVPVQTYGIPGNTSGAGYTLPLPPQGLVFAAGISYAITGGMADTDATAIGAGDVVLNWGSI